MGRGTSRRERGKHGHKAETYVTFRVHGDVEQSVSVSTTVEIGSSLRLGVGPPERGEGGAKLAYSAKSPSWTLLSQPQGEI